MHKSVSALILCVALALSVSLAAPRRRKVEALESNRLRTNAVVSTLLALPRSDARTKVGYKISLSKLEREVVCSAFDRDSSRLLLEKHFLPEHVDGARVDGRVGNINSAAARFVAGFAGRRLDMPAFREVTVITWKAQSYYCVVARFADSKRYATYSGKVYPSGQIVLKGQEFGPNTHLRLRALTSVLRRMPQITQGTASLQLKSGMSHGIVSVEVKEGSNRAITYKFPIQRIEPSISKQAWPLPIGACTAAAIAIDQVLGDWLTDDDRRLSSLSVSVSKDLDCDWFSVEVSTNSNWMSFQYSARIDSRGRMKSKPPFEW